MEFEVLLLMSFVFAGAFFSIQSENMFDSMSRAEVLFSQVVGRLLDTRLSSANQQHTINTIICRFEFVDPLMNSVSPFIDHIGLHTLAKRIISEPVLALVQLHQPQALALAHSNEYISL